MKRANLILHCAANGRQQSVGLWSLSRDQFFSLALEQFRLRFARRFARSGNAYYNGSLQWRCVLNASLLAAPAVSRPLY